MRKAIEELRAADTELDEAIMDAAIIMPPVKPPFSAISDSAMRWRRAAARPPER